MPNLLTLGYFAARAGRFRARQPRPTDEPYVKVVGPDPARVLLAGAGVAAGYGVRRHADSSAGPLAELLAERLERGVVVEVRAAAVLPMRRAVAHLGLNGAHTFDAVVFAPCYLEGQLPPSPAWARRMSDVVSHLQSTGGPALSVVLTGVPAPSGTGTMDRAVADAAEAANRAFETVAAQRDRVRYRSVPNFGSVRDATPFDAAYYRATAETVADELVQGLERRTTRS